MLAVGWTWQALETCIGALGEAAQRCRPTALSATVEAGEKQEIPRNQGKLWCVMYVSALNKIWSQEPTAQIGDICPKTVGPLSLQCSITAGLSMEFVSTAVCVRHWLTELMQHLWKSLGLNSCCGGLFFKQWLIQEIKVYGKSSCSPTDWKGPLWRSWLLIRSPWGAIASWSRQMCPRISRATVQQLKARWDTPGHPKRAHVSKVDNWLKL